MIFLVQWGLSRKALLEVVDNIFKRVFASYWVGSTRCNNDYFCLLSNKNSKETLFKLILPPYLKHSAIAALRGALIAEWGFLSISVLKERTTTFSGLWVK